MGYLYSPEQLKEIIVNATKNRAAQKRMLKDDKDIEQMSADIKTLKDAYNDIIKGCDYVIELSVERLSALEEL